MASTIQRLLPSILSSDLTGSTQFYTLLFDFEIAFESDWFVQLRSPKGQIELGFISPTSDIVPQGVEPGIQSAYLTFVVDQVEDVFFIAQSEEFNVLQPPHDTFYGQRRLLLRDPNGWVVDVSSPITK